MPDSLYFSPFEVRDDSNPSGDGLPHLSRIKLGGAATERVVVVELGLHLILHVIDLQCLDLDQLQLPGKVLELNLEELDLDFDFEEFSWDVRNFRGPKVSHISPELP